MSIADIDYHEYFKPSVIQDLKQAFDSCDANKEGILGDRELLQVLKKLGRTVTRAQLLSVMKEVDVDGTGKIDFDQLCLLEIKLTGAKPRADLISYEDYLSERTISKLEQLFVQYDVGGTGSISANSLGKVLAEMQRTTNKEELREVMEEVDSQHKGTLKFHQLCSAFAVLTNARKQINYREFLSNEDVSTYHKLFLESDMRGTGQLSLQELNQLFKSLGISLKKAQLQGLFVVFDEDQSGGIDFEEFCIMMLRLRGLRQLRTINPLTCSCESLWKEEGFAVKELQRSGFLLPDLQRVGIPVDRIYREGSFTALELRRAGYSAKELRRGGVGLMELRVAGFSLAELRLAGFSEAALFEANRSLHSSLSAGDLSVLPQCCPRSQLSKGAALSSAGFQIVKAPFGKVAPRQMTPMIREHTDWRPGLRHGFNSSKLERNFGDECDSLVEANVKLYQQLHNS